MGNRYGKLRINHIDIGNNEELSEKCFEVLADNLMAVSLKTINFDGSMNGHLQVIVKIINITKAFDS